MGRSTQRALPWWQTEVIYQVYPRSFADGNGDGIGDLPGLIDRLDYLQWLGIGGIWVNPTMPSPNVDWGYDVSDYCDVHPELGALEDIDELVAEAKARGIRIILDLVPNHTSDQHPWFRNALAGDTRYRDYYVWANPAPDGGPPNNWISVFGGPAWEWHEASGQYYLHNFHVAQPDLNWWNEDVREEFDHILRFWFDRGIAGLRIDVAHALIKDKELRDNLPIAEDAHPYARGLRQELTYSMNRPEVHAIFKRWRTLCDAYDPQRILVGETFVYELDKWAEFYGSGSDELNLAFNFPFALGALEAGELKQIAAASEAVIPPDAWPAWMMSNHDIGRAITRWAGDNPNKGRLLVMLLMTLRGTPFLYYGEELGMPETPLTREELRDRVGVRDWPGRRIRDRSRTPMHWDARPGAGFTTPGTEPWLAFGDYESVNVAGQRVDPDSFLSFTRSLIRLRRESTDLNVGAYVEEDGPDPVWVFRRGRRTTVALNLSDEIVSVPGLAGKVRASTTPGRFDEEVSGHFDCEPWGGVVVEQQA